MKRSASLDFLRGAAAFAVAVPHYLTANAPFSPTVEAVAVASVEVFFVLSGFVLAPQIVDWVVGRPWRNLGVFLARRWMRTIPPYVAALVVVALMTGNLFTADTLRYLFYVENLVRSSNAVDFYPVAWSLAVEEWFYLLFAPLLFLAGRALGRSDRRVDVAFAILFVLVVAALRAFAAPADWDLNVRRVTLFRIDSIVWGFLLYLALERRPLLALKTARGGRSARRARRGVRRRRRARIPGRDAGARGRARRPAGLSLRVRPVRRRGGRRSSGRPTVCSRGRGSRRLSFYLGRISYSAYLFHIVIVMALKPLIARLAARSLQLALYVAVDLRLLDRLLARLRAADPGRAAGLSPQAARRSRPRPKRRRDLPARPLAGEGRVRTARPSCLARPRPPRRRARSRATPSWRMRPVRLYPALIATAGPCGRARRARRAVRRLRSGSLRGRSSSSRSRLPAADALYRSSTGVPIAGSIANPTYSYRAARENPAAFAMWWFYYLNEWIRDDGIRGAIEKPDPQKELPVRPGSRRSRADVRHDHPASTPPASAGRRSPPAKGDRFRIVALGESQTFGPTLHEGEKPWPELLQALFAPARVLRPADRGDQRAEPRPIRSKTISSACGATSCR